MIWNVASVPFMLWIVLIFEMPPAILTALAYIPFTYGLSGIALVLAVGLFIYHSIRFNDKHTHLEYDDHKGLTEERRKHLMGVSFKRYGESE
jgi:hypothetical protein